MVALEVDDFFTNLHCQFHLALKMLQVMLRHIHQGIPFFLSMFKSQYPTHPTIPQTLQIEAPKTYFLYRRTIKLHSYPCLPGKPYRLGGMEGGPNSN